MNVTNGTVSRTFKPGDYEARTVSFSFTIDPGEDFEACAAIVAEAAERRARGLPSVSNVGDKPAKAKKPIAPVEAPDPTVSAVSAWAAAETSASSGEPKVITDDELMKACQATTTRLHDAQPTKNTVRGFVEKAGMSVITIPQEDRAAFLAALAALKVEA